MAMCRQSSAAQGWRVQVRGAKLLKERRNRCCGVLNPDHWRGWLLSSCSTRYVLLAELGQAAAVRKVLPKQAVEVFVAAALPRTVGVGEVADRIQNLINSGVLGGRAALLHKLTRKR